MLPWYNIRALKNKKENISRAITRRRKKEKSKKRVKRASVAGWREKKEKRKRKEREKIMIDCHRLAAVGSSGASWLAGVRVPPIAAAAADGTRGATSLLSPRSVYQSHRAHRSVCTRLTSRVSTGCRFVYRPSARPLTYFSVFIFFSSVIKSCVRVYLPFIILVRQYRSASVAVTNRNFTVWWKTVQISDWGQQIFSSSSSLRSHGRHSTHG